MNEPSVALRAARHAALGDPTRLAIIDALMVSDFAPSDLRRIVNIESNLLAHHLDTLEAVGLIRRTRSSGDGRRRYVRLVHESLEELRSIGTLDDDGAMFICSANSARSQLAAALWREMVGTPAESAGTHPADRVNPAAVAAARRAGLDIGDATPQPLTPTTRFPRLVVTVCDQAHEELDVGDAWLHWSVPDPVVVGTNAAFDATVTELRHRIATVIHANAAAS